jgi:predicted PurR-regulated permease PerM
MDETASYRPQPHSRARLIFAGGLVILILWLIQGVLIALAWAVVLAISTWPLYRHFRKLIGPKHNTLSSLVFTLLTGVCILSLVSLVLLEVGRDGPVLLDWLRQAQQSGVPVPGWMERLPLLGSYVAEWWRVHLGSPAALAGLFDGIDTNGVATWTSTIGGAVLHRLFLTALTLMSLFFLLRDGHWLGERLLILANGWLGEPGERLAEKIAEAVRGTVSGTVAVAFGEGLLIGFGYVIAGVPHAVLFGALTMMFALLPFGAWIVFTAASLTLFISTSSVIIPLGLFAFSSAIMLLGDNIVQPALIGGAAHLPFFWALLGIIGGLESFGLIGLFIGPVMMAALLTVWREWGDVSPKRREPTDVGSSRL